MGAIEVERKLRCDHGALRERLLAAGFEHRGTVKQVDTYFDVPMRDLAVTDEALRLRRVEDDQPSVELTYKGPRSAEHAKARTERTVRVEDAHAMAAVLEALDLRPVATVAKQRERYTRDDVTVVLDAVEGLGTFVEVERVVDGGADHGAVGAHIDEVIGELGLDPQDAIGETYLELFQADA